MANKLNCPKCGSEMNHHANKLVYPSEKLKTQAIDPALGGLIEETHGCPACGAVMSRRPD
ncbi:MAG TPA: hypothetical protein VFX54_17085 [Candidatus Binatia bacterium]|jgi:ribosomal protein S27AE|nr:hypothetical protein [Candidatus Binatia bacterium]